MLGFWFFPLLDLPWCAGGAGTAAGQEGGGGDARLPQAMSRGNSAEGIGILELGERGKKVAGGRKEKEVIFLNFCFLPGLQEGQGLRCREGSRIMVYERDLSAPAVYFSTGITQAALT